METKKTTQANASGLSKILHNPIQVRNAILLCFLLGLQLANGQNQNKITDTEIIVPTDTLVFPNLKFNNWMFYRQLESAKWQVFLKRIAISESMETYEQIGEPAQLQFTFPKDKQESYVINLGVSYQLNKPENTEVEERWKTKVKAEFHKNTLLEKEQENLEAGYQGQWRFSKVPDSTKTMLYVIFDPKYAYDGIENRSSLVSNMMFTMTSTTSSFLKFNRDNSFGKRVNFVPTFFLGAQLQDNFKASDENKEGFILRPVFSGSAALYFNKPEKRGVLTLDGTKKEKPQEGIVKLSVTYTGRKDMINNTANDEGYTSLLKAKAEVFLLNTPIRVTIGGSFNKGSDPMKGLAKQEYWLLSLNVLK
ncbi:hypothetical protein [Flavobacterium humi]|uniref:Uncharacterized protein n=1 Tax=Flavobacterium humi TaxID=2562683 RepID=A0A4Z0LCB8_9FLAO|nr:hypothetical protein [Flavobacterium humi]TGD59513.1 hypothetical protein E4635_00840 [Flavobacterium humi]